MIQGTVTPDREAVISLKLRGPNGDEEEIEAIVDTGFNDYLTLPSSTLSQLALPFAAPTQGMLADGSIVSLDYYEVTVVWDNQPRKILALEAEGGPLVGMSLLYGYRLTLDAIDGGPVTIDELP